TGMAVAGLMGSSESESLSYTVFGREVNLASRLEGASGRGRIFISESTYAHLLRYDPALAAPFVLLEPIKMKGFRSPVRVSHGTRRPESRPMGCHTERANSFQGTSNSTPADSTGIHHK